MISKSKRKRTRARTYTQTEMNRMNLKKKKQIYIHKTYLRLENWFVNIYMYICKWIFQFFFIYRFYFYISIRPLLWNWKEEKQNAKNMLRIIYQWYNELFSFSFFSILDKNNVSLFLLIVLNLIWHFWNFQFSFFFLFYF